VLKNNSLQFNKIGNKNGIKCQRLTPPEKILKISLLQFKTITAMFSYHDEQL